MKTTADVVRYIEEFMANIQDRPDMYAANPESLEGQLSLLDGLRKQILAPDADRFALHDAGYTAFLRSNGFGVANFCHRQRAKRNRAITRQDLELFQKLAEFWKSYMTSSHFAGSSPPDVNCSVSSGAQ